MGIFADRQNLSDDLIIYIKQGILDGVWSPGDRIVETKLARELGVSQTPIREAINRLVGEEVLTIVPNKGTIVRDLTLIDIYEIYSLRAVLEGLAIRLVTKNATEEEIRKLESLLEDMKNKLYDDSIKSLSVEVTHLHDVINELSGNKHLLSMQKTVSFRVRLANSVVNKTLGVNFTKEKDFEKHKELVDAIKKGDPDHSEWVMREHVHWAYKEFTKFYSDRNENKLLSIDEWI